MNKIISSEWLQKPVVPGAYWLKDNIEDVYRICQIIIFEGVLYMTIPGVEGGMPISEMGEDKKLSFFGPLSLPEGVAHIFANAIYKPMNTPVDPQEIK